MKIVSFFALLLCLPAIAFAAPPLVDHQWLGANLSKENLLIVDLRSKQQYEYAHIPGSSHTDVNLWRQPDKNKVESMLPGRAHLEKLMSQMGATPDSHIVLVTGDSAGELASATRVYWTLAQIGHKEKSILDGGIHTYARARLPLERGSNPVKPTEYSIFRVRQDQITADQIHGNSSLNLLDARSGAEFMGVHQGAPDERAGTIPGAKLLPYDWFTRNGGGAFASPENLATVLATAELDNDKPTVVFCHTGQRASLSWFVMHELLGRKDTLLYDGSTREWSKRKDLPIHQAIGVNHQVK